LLSRIYHMRPIDVGELTLPQVKMLLENIEKVMEVEANQIAQALAELFGRRR